MESQRIRHDFATEQQQAHQGKKERTQINKMRNEKRDDTAETTEIQRIMRDYYYTTSANKKDNLEEMDKFLERHNLPRLNQDKLENVNRPITSDTETVILKTLNKVQDHMTSQVNYISHLEKSYHLFF